MNHGRSFNPGFRFPYEMLNRFGWRVAAPGGRWREESSSGLRSRQSGIGYGLSGSGTGSGLNPNLVLNT